MSVCIRVAQDKRKECRICNELKDYFVIVTCSCIYSDIRRFCLSCCFVSQIKIDECKKCAVHNSLDADEGL